MKRLYFTLCFFLTLCGSSFLQAQAECLILEAPHTSAPSGSSACVDITAVQFEEILAMQLSLTWDKNILDFQEVNNFNLPDLSDSNFGTPDKTGYPEHLTFVWNANIGSGAVTLAEDEVLFSICFDVIGNSGERSLIEFDNSPTALEFLAGDYSNTRLSGASLISGSITVGTAPADAPTILAIDCPQANNCSEVPPAGIQTETTGGTAPYSYSWTGPYAGLPNTPNLTELIPGDYRVVVQDAAGLTNSLLFHLTGELPLKLTNVQITQPENCEQAENGAISFSIAGGSGSYEYQWSDGASSANRTDLSPGLYELTVTDLFQGCSVYQGFTIFTTSNIQVETTKITPVSCGTTNTGAIELEFGDDSEGLTINWSNGATGAAISGLATGTYVATITDSMNCSIEWSGKVNTSAEVEFSGIEGYEDCEESSGYINLTVPGDPADYTYAWNTGETTKDLSGLSFGSYRVTVTHTDSGCSGYRQFYIKDEDFLTGSTWECTVVDEQTIFAKVSTIVWAGGTPPYTFTWSNGDSMTDDLIGFTTVSLPTTLIVTITDAKGCSTVAEPITPDCNSGGEPTFSTASSYDCITDENGEQTQAQITYRVRAGGTPPYTFSWSNGLTESGVTESTIVAPVGSNLSYSVTVTDQAGLTHVSRKIAPSCATDGPPLYLNIGEGSVNESGESVCIPFTVQNFDLISGMQFTLSWDPSQLILDTIFTETLPYFDAGNYNPGPFAGVHIPGQATLFWFDKATLGVTLPDSTVVLEACFTTIGNDPVTEILISNHPTAIEISNISSQRLPLIFSSGFITVQNQAAKSVWPGDTDNNGLVDHFDLLNIGLAFGASAYPRPEGSLDWEAQFGAPWGLSTPNTEVDFRHVDTDGNGTINAIDTLALALNYRLFNENWNGEDGYTQREDLPESARTTGTPIYVDTYAVQEGDMPVFDLVLGDDASTESKVYGLAFSINYDPLAIVPGSLQLSFENSWIGTADEDMLTFYRVDSQAHRVHVAMTRTNGIDITGKGAIAQLLVTIEDVIFRSDNYDIPISIENARLINFNEEAVPVLERSSVITVTTTNTIDPSLDQQIKVYPVPAQDMLFLKIPQLRVETIELYDLEGRQIQRWSGSRDQLPLIDLPQGTYALKLITDQGVAVRRIVIMN